LLGFLKLKTLGRFPGGLEDTVRPTVDMFPYWINHQIETSQIGAPPQVVIPTGGGAARLFTVNPVTVPADEWWWVRNFDVQVAVPQVTDLILDLAPYVFENNGFQFVPANYRSSAVGGGAGGQTSVWTGSQNFWVAPGSQFGVFNSRATLVAGVTCFGNLSWARFKI
jgi:hypothetical protein